MEKGWDVQVAARHLHRDQLRFYGLADLPVHELTAPSRKQRIRRLRAVLETVGVGGLRHLSSVSVRAASYHVPSLRAVMAQSRPAVIHAHFAHNGLLASMATRKQIPVIVDYHGYDVLSLARDEGWKHFAHFLNGSHGIVHSSFLEHEVAAHLHVRLHRVTLGVDQNVFEGRNRDGRWPGVLTLLTVGRLVDVKGHDVAIRAFATLVGAEGSGRARLFIVGDGPERQSLEDLARELDVEDRVIFSGALSQTEVAQAMAEADFLLMPSLPLGGWQESFGRVAIEGLASGLAVIGTRTGGLAETIGSGGWTVEPGDHSKLAEKIEEIHTTTKPSEVAQRARAQAARFDIQKMRDDYDHLTRSVVSDARAP
jgi:colanic acid/amylovoran biosynthesis glycosyltransferase